MALLALGPSAGCGLETHGTRSAILPVDASSDGSSDSGTPSLPDTGTVQPNEPDVGVVDPNACDVTGTYALRANLQVKWEGTSLGPPFPVPVLAEGQGNLEIVTLLEVVREGGALNGRVRVCGVQTPDFGSNTLGETYAVRFPEAMWEASSMPNWQLPLTAECEKAGCALEAEPLLAFLGLSLQNPEAPWPSSRNDPALTFYDHDEDGLVGLTVTTADATMNTSAGTPYARPPVLSALQAERANKIMLAIRFATHFQGAVDDCDHFSGTGADTTVDVRAPGCTYLGGLTGTVETPCDDQLSDFVDGNLPAWEVIEARWRGIRLASGATCVEARAAD